MIELIYIWTLYALHLAAAAYIQSLIFGWKHQGKYKYLYRVGIYMITYISIFFIRMIFPEGTWLRVLVNGAILMWYMVILFGGTLRARILFAVVVEIVNFVLEFLNYFIMMLSGIAFEEYSNDLYNTHTYYAVTIFYMLYYIGIMFVIWIYYLRKKFIKEQLVFLIIPLYQLVQLLIFLVFDISSEVGMLILGLIIVCFDILLDCGVLWFMIDMGKRYETEEKLSALYNQRRYELEYYRSMNLHMEQLREIRHDYLNQIQTVELLLEKDGTRKLLSEYREKQRKQTSKRLQELEGQRHGRYSANPVLDAVLTLKKAAADQKNIFMDISMDISTDKDCHMGAESSLDEVEICSLFGNLLDNAIEACEKVQSGRREIFLEISQQGNALYIRCRNSFDMENTLQGGFWISRKAEKEAHGIGLKMIEKICKTHNGHMEKSVKDNMVCFEICV